jgi:hypothetical protein
VSGFDARLRIEGQEVTVTMKTITLVFALASALFAYSPRANARPAEKRGTVEVTGHAVKVVTTGPVLLHGYSGFSGGVIFVAPVGTGADADCAAALANNRSTRSTPLVADRVAYVPVGAGQVACLVTNTPRSFELLWHAFATEGSETYMARAKSR